MSVWLLPIAVELAMTLLFCGVLVYLRRSLTRKGTALWLCLWTLRGAASLFALGYLSENERIALFVTAPLQVAFAMGLVVLAVRLENQKEQLRLVNDELTRLRRETAGHADVDPLTGLLNRAALTRWLDAEPDFQGLVVVCDMDDFKPLNDIYGHLIGDDILHDVGKLIRTSIRENDKAFRWGGDEFVIFFRTGESDLVDSRMRRLEEHLRNFHIRHHGSTPVGFSWGISATTGRTAKETLAEADRLMYESKRARAAQSKARAGEIST